MPRRFKNPKPLGRYLNYRRQAGCNWCWHGERPDINVGICEDCVYRFKLALQSKRWQRARLAFLGSEGNSVCHVCRDRGFVTAAAEVNHIHPWRFFPDLFWFGQYWQPICGDCHKAETNENHGGFGRPRHILPAPPFDPNRDF